MKIRFNGTTFKVAVLQQTDAETLLRYEESGEEEWTPNVDLERYIREQKEHEERKNPAR